MTADSPAEIADVVPAVGAVVSTAGTDADADGGDEQVLLVHSRARDAWTVPFGRVDPGESVRQTVRREVREEASVTVRVDRLAGVYSDPETQVFEHRSGRLLQFVTTLVVCSPVESTSSPEPDGDEVDDAAFVSRQRLPEMPPTGEWVRAALDGDGVVLQ